MIKLLDCTLRDGGYVNNWNFNKHSIKSIISHLSKAGIDHIELGFLQKNAPPQASTIFNSIQEAQHFIPENKENTQYWLMLTYGQCELAQLPKQSFSSPFPSIDGFRIIFKKDTWRKALNFAAKVQDKGYKIFINPQCTNLYSQAELQTLLQEVNAIHPMAFTLVDTLGMLQKNTLLPLFKKIHEYLQEDIQLCFHAHNSLQLAFSLVKELLPLHTHRSLIIDASLRGMGRGAGNLPTEELLRHLNAEHNTAYLTAPINDVLQNIMQPLFQRTPWRHHALYQEAAKLACHPDYATFLLKKNTINTQNHHKILRAIPHQHRHIFNLSCIEKIYKNVGK